MSSSNFSFLKFIEQAGIALIEDYFKYKKIQCELPENASIVDIFECIKKLPEDVFRLIEEDFLTVSQLVSEKGSLDLALEAQQQGVNLPELESEEARALWCFINEEAVFQAAIVWDQIQYMKNWQDEYFDTDVSNIDWDDRAKNIAQRLKDHFWEKDERKVKCAHEVYKHQDRVSIVLYPEGFPKSTLQYREGTSDQIRHYSARAVHELYFIVNLTEKKVSVRSQARYGRDRMRELKTIFFEEVLASDFNDGNSKKYKLTHLLDESFGKRLKEMLPMADNVEFVKIKELGFIDKDRKNQVTIVKAFGREGDPSEIYEMVAERQLNAANGYVSFVQIQVKFPGLGRRGSCSFYITYPNGHTLGKTQNEQKCKGYLKNWEIDHE